MPHFKKFRQITCANRKKNLYAIKVAPSIMTLYFGQLTLRLPEFYKKIKQLNSMKSSFRSGASL
jgi:hypothetical protein